MKTYGGMSEEEIGRRWDASVTLISASGFTSQIAGDLSYSVGIARRATKHFLPGDVFPIIWMNGGGERQPVWCRTRRGRSLEYFYVEYANFESYGRYDAYDGGREWHVRAEHHKKSKDGEPLNDKALVQIFEPPPGSIDGNWPAISGAAVRRYVVESTRAWHAGSRVGASTPAPFEV